jgi:hypothetical protein
LFKLTEQFRQFLSHSETAVLPFWTRFAPCN